MTDDIRCLFGEILHVETDYGMVKLKLGRKEIILPPESTQVLNAILNQTISGDDYED